MSPTTTSKKRTPVKAAEPSTSTNTAVDALAPASAVLREISVDQIDPHPSNPRRELGDLSELAASIREQGLLEPVLLVPGAQGSGKFPSRYTVIAGHRRTAAAREAGVATVPAIIRECMSEAEQLEVMLVENLHRSDLTVFEEAHGMRGLFDFGMKRTQIAKRTGRAIKTVAQRLAIANLPASVESQVTNKTMTLDEAITLADIAGRNKGVYDDLVAQLDAGELRGWAINRAFQSLDRLDADKEWMEYIDSTGVKQIDIEARCTATDIKPLGIKPDAHTACPGAAVYIGATVSYWTKKEQTDWVCTDPATHHPEVWEKLQAKSTAAYGGVSEEEREARAQLDADLEAAEAARWSWICHLFTEAGTGRDTQRAIIVAAAVDHATDDQRDLGKGPGLPDGINWPTDPALALALAVVPSIDEFVPASQWSYSNTVKGDRPWEVTARAAALKWLKVLEAAGYTLTDVEVSIGEAFDQAAPVDEGSDA